MISKINGLFNKYRELIMYLIVGGLTTFINICIYFIIEMFLHYQIANIIAWIGSVTFAFFANKKLVFEARDNSKILNEAFMFYFARIISLIIDLLIMFILIDILSFNDLLSKIISNIVIVVINYFISKFIFKKGTHN